MGLQTFAFPRACVLLLGNEQNGVPAPLLELVDTCVEVCVCGGEGDGVEMGEEESAALVYQNGGLCRCWSLWIPVQRWWVIEGACIGMGERA